MAKITVSMAYQYLIIFNSKRFSGYRRSLATAIKITAGNMSMQLLFLNLEHYCTTTCVAILLQKPEHLDQVDQLIRQYSRQKVCLCLCVQHTSGIAITHTCRHQ